MSETREPYSIHSHDEPAAKPAPRGIAFAQMSVSDLADWCCAMKTRIDALISLPRVAGYPPSHSEVVAEQCLLEELCEFFGELTDDLDSIALQQEQQQATAVDLQPTRSMHALVVPFPRTPVASPLPVPVPIPPTPSIAVGGNLSHE